MLLPGETYLRVGLISYKQFLAIIIAVAAIFLGFLPLNSVKSKILSAISLDTSLNY